MLAARNLAGTAGDQESNLSWEERLASVSTLEFDLLCEELVLLLDDDLRRYAIFRLLGYSTAEIAGELACTQRKVQRKIELIRICWEQQLSD